MINLNARQFDNNVYINGTILGNEFTDTWSHGTLSGEANGGTFYAFKQP